MPERQTSIWVPIDRVVPHPENANRMSEADFAKLAANIDQSGEVPPLIVRTLELSKDFIELFEADKLQVLDGEHRHRYCQDRGMREVEVRVWRGVSDEQAKQILLTFNRLGGKDDPGKRRKLLQDLLEIEDVDTLALVLPEDESSLKALLEEEEEDERDPGSPESLKESLEVDEPVTIFMTADQKAMVMSTIQDWLDENDPEQLIDRCREGAALAAVCERSRLPV